MIQHRGSVIFNRFIRPEIYELGLELSQLAAAAKPGHFLHLHLEETPGVMLRRPLSLAGVDGNQIRLLVRSVGTGTRALAKINTGTRLDILGPLGNPFDHTTTRRAILVGGGIGAAPLLFLQDELLTKGAEVTFFLGAKTRDEFPLTEDEVTARSIIPTTDDGTYGQIGFVSVQMENWLKDYSQEGFQVYSCGPLLMMKEVDRLCRQYGLPHQASLENRMGCGIGICQGCAVRLNRGEHDPRGGYRLVCKDGPVFDASQIDWPLLEASYR
jgi:dihydroorotate dehydrogenase electron transfer subunit